MFQPLETISLAALAACIAVSATTAAEPTTAQVRAAAAVALRSGTAAQTGDKMRIYVRNQVAGSARLSSRDLERVALAADCARLLELLEKTKPDPVAIEWLLGTDERTRTFVETIEPGDYLKKCVGIIGTLCAHDPGGRDAFDDLILALAVVWDTPRRPPVHSQIGKKVLAYKPEVTARYDFFKQLYSPGGGAKIGYQQLSVDELIFVVDTAVPLSELEWARSKVKGTLDTWDKKFSSINYDHARLRNSEYVWSHAEPYTLEAIRRLGGICVDQAYYAVLTARAHGIPAIYFHAMGVGGGHAWFSYMKGPGEWTLDVGRYKSQNYTTGFAVNPQTNQRMTDHDVEYTCERSLHSDSFEKACAYTAIAELLEHSDPKNARRYAREARRLVKRYLRPWEIEERVLLRQQDYSGLLELLSDQKDAFRKYPDILTAAAQRIGDALRKAGRGDEADKLMRSLAGSVDDGRDDLQRSFESDRISQLVAAGELRKARRELEQLLDDQREEGSKVMPLILQYLEITKQSGESHAAAKFLEKYIGQSLEKNNFQEWYATSLLKLLRQAYENDNDSKGIAEVEKRIERLKY